LVRGDGWGPSVDIGLIEIELGSCVLAINLASMPQIINLEWKSRCNVLKFMMH